MGDSSHSPTADPPVERPAQVVRNRWRGGLVLLMLLIGVGIADALVYRGWMTREADTRSRDVGTNYRVPFLKRFLPMKSEIEAAEFEIRDIGELARETSGARRWEIEAVLKVASKNLPLWLSGQEVMDEADLSWGYRLLPAEAYWTTSSAPNVFQEGETTIAIFEPERIVFIRTVSER